MRKPWPRYFMDVAYQVATRATCDRKHVGAVIVTVDKHIVATGYNSAIRAAPHCDDVGHLMEGGHCIRTVHAESNAIAQAAKNGAIVDKATLYCTALPCWICFRLICNAGIAHIVYAESYRAGEHIQRVYEHAHYARVTVHRLNEQNELVVEHT